MSRAALTDRAAGVLLGAACGDALGVPYEFARRLGPTDVPVMQGGGLGPYRPGEYSDDTQMAVCIAQVAAAGADLTGDDALDEVAERFLHWRAEGASDVGVQTSSVLQLADSGSGPAGRRLRLAAREYSRSSPRSAGNGALMRTAVVGLTRLDDRDATAAAARAVAELTHADPLAGDACVLWSEAVRLAVAEHRLDLAGGLDLVPGVRRGQWSGWIADAAGGAPATAFAPNGFTVTALQAAWASIVTTPVRDDDPELGLFACQHLVHALRTAVRIGDDTDTVAAIAGGLLGAYWGGSAVPAGWRSVVHGWPDVRARELVTLGILTVNGGRVDTLGWPAGDVVVDAVARDVDAEVCGGRVRLGTSRTDVGGSDAVVSLCRVGTAASRTGPPRLEVHLVDSDDPADNPNLIFVLADTGWWIRDRIADGRNLLVHCVAAEARTPAVAVASGLASPDDVLAALPHARGSGLLWEAAIDARSARATADAEAAAALDTIRRLHDEDATPAWVSDHPDAASFVVEAITEHGPVPVEADVRPPWFPALSSTGRLVAAWWPDGSLVASFRGERRVLALYRAH